MKIEFVEFSLVIIASEHNPTILNPDFLKINKIVEDEWDWTVIGQPITTPAFSTVTYDSRVVINVEPMKLQITDTSGANIHDNHICKIIAKYVNTLLHVKYNALGINFTNIIEFDSDDEATSFLIERFLKDGNWNKDNTQLNNVGFKFSYNLDGGNITLSIDRGVRQNNPKPIIICRANFHRDLDVDNVKSIKQIEDSLSNIDEDYKKFEELHAKIFEEEKS